MHTAGTLDTIGLETFASSQIDELKCDACVRNLPSHHPRHTKPPGECHWAEAIPRIGSASSSSRGPRPQQHIVPDQPFSAPPASTPPKCNLGVWHRVYDSYLIDVLAQLSLTDGWHDLTDGTKALVMSHTRMTREPQPRFSNDEYSLRSTFARFPEHAHEHGTWWQVEDNVHYKGIDRNIGYPIECMIHIFTPEVGVSPTEKIVHNEEHEPPIDEPPLPPPRRRAINSAPEARPPEPIEYGEPEQEVPEIEPRRELAVPAPEVEHQIEEAAEPTEPVDWSTGKINR